MMSIEVLIAFAMLLIGIGVVGAVICHDLFGGYCKARIAQLEAELELSRPIVNAAAPATERTNR